MTVRVEEQGVLLWNKETGGTAYISGAELDALGAWAAGGKETGFISRVKQLGLLQQQSKGEILLAVEQAMTKKAPLRSFCAPESLHIELTTRCPLQCPQCYHISQSSLEPCHDLPYDVLLELLDQAQEMQVFQIALGGGEPLLYPQLVEVISEVSRRDMSCSITTSGAGLDEYLVDQLINSGLNHLQVSLNGSVEKINAYSRDGYTHAVAALELIKGKNLSFGVNWVARKDNLEDFPEMLALVKHLGAGNINVLRYKPSAGETYAHVCLDFEEQQRLAAMIQGSKDVSIKVDSAFSNLLCHLNSRCGLFSGCGAGRRFLAVDAAGNFRPCSHINLAEPMTELKNYWIHSPDLALFREIEDRVGEPCASCRYLSGCRGCRAVALGTDGQLGQGDETCSFYRERQWIDGRRSKKTSSSLRK